MKKPAILINIIFLILLLIGSIWVLAGCVTREEQRRDGCRIIAYERQER